MSLQDFLNSDLLRKHTTSKQEISDLKKVVEREVKDASVQAISNDRRFACSYNAALQLSHIVLAAAGFRTNSAKAGHHKTTFEAVELIVIAAETKKLTALFEVCRKKRNALDYSVSGSISDSEVVDIQQSVLEYNKLVDGWLNKNHQSLV